MRLLLLLGLLAAAGFGCKPAAVAQPTLLVKVVGVEGQPFPYGCRIVLNWFPDAKNVQRIERDLPAGTATSEFAAPAETRGSVTVFASNRWLEPVEVAPIGARTERAECLVRVVHEPIRVRGTVRGFQDPTTKPAKLVLRARRSASPPSARLFAIAPRTISDPIEVPYGDDLRIEVDLPNEFRALGYDEVELGWREWRCVAKVPGGFRFGVLDLGERTLTVPVDVVSGAVVDARGKPALGAVLEVRDAGTHAPVDARELLVTKEERGRFAIRGWVAARSLEVLASHEEHAPSQPRAVELGAKDALITLGEGGTIVLEATWGSGEFPADLELWVRGTQATDRVATAVERKSPTLVRITWRGLPPGPYAVLGRRGSGEVRTLLADVTVVARAPASDPRLTRFDLAEALGGK